MMAFTFIYFLLPETKGKSIEENIKNIIPDMRSSVMSIFFFQNILLIVYFI